MKKIKIIFFCWCVASGFLAPLGHAETGLPVNSIKVIGYAEVEKGGQVAELQRRAIKDALKNALLLTNCVVEYTAVSENLKLKSSSVTFKSSGFVKSTKVISSELIKKSSPQLYKVVLQVEVVPVEEANK
jgi:hypothetical protein